MFDFVTVDAEAELAELKADYEALINRPVADSDPEMGWLTSLAYKVTVLKTAINHTGNMNFLRYATGAALDELGFKFNVYRLEEAFARCTVRYTQVGGQSQLVPAGNRVKTGDGKFIFQTVEAVTVGVGDAYKDIICECLVAGKEANGYAVGEVNTMLDPLPYITTAVSIDVTAGGSDAENDEEYRERIQLASNQFSVAGPDDAYVFFAKSAHPDIVDVKPNGPGGGVVELFILLQGGGVPGAPILQLVYDKCNPKNVRPLNDIVEVYAATPVDYDISIELILKKNAIASEVYAQVYPLLEAYADKRLNSLAMDVVMEQLTAIATPSGVYKPNILLPGADLSIGPGEFARCNSISLVITGSVDEL